MLIIKNIFANRLFALLLQYGIDLRQLQIRCGVYLKTYFLITDYADYVGSIKLAKEYLEALPPLQKEESDTEPNKGGMGTSKDAFLKGLTEKQKQHFKDAIEAKMMEETDIGFKWLYGREKGNVRLAFFLQKVFNPRQSSATPYKKLEALFGVRNLAQTTNQMADAKKHQKWKDEIIKVIDIKHP